MAGIAALNGGAGITYNPIYRKYVYDGNQYNTEAEAEAAMNRPPWQATASTPSTVSVQTPSGQTVQGPATVTTNGLIGGGDVSGSMASLQRAASGGGTAAATTTGFDPEAERLRIAGVADARDAATAAANAQASRDAALAATNTASASALSNSSAAQAALDRLFAKETAAASADTTTARDTAAAQAQTARDIAAATTARDAATTASDRTAAQAALDRAFATATAATSAQTAKDATAEQERYQTQTAATTNTNALSAQDRMMAYIKPFMDSLGGGSSDGTPAAPTATDTANDALARNAESAAFARAKDQTADIARSSLMSLRAAGAERGVNVAGATNPALLGAESSLMAKAQQPLADLTRQQAVDTSTRAQAVDDRNYAGNIAIQGQKAALAPSLLSLLKVGGLY